MIRELVRRAPFVMAAIGTLAIVSRWRSAERAHFLTRLASISHLSSLFLVLSFCRSSILALAPSCGSRELELGWLGIMDVAGCSSCFGAASGATI
ncbi:unnamed protein product [Lota lota]